MTMRKGFTLIELLVVMAIMAMLGVAATGGYNALVRGMNERSAVAAASALLRSAKERAAVDRVPTAVFCYNKLVKDTSGAEDENAVVVGVMTAVRRSGRITLNANPLLYDEFGDLDQTYESTDDESELQKRRGMKLYRFPPKSGGAMQYSIVADAVYKRDRDPKLLNYLFSIGDTTNVVGSAFYNLNKSSHEPSGWKAGTPYAFEIGELQLPYGFIFGTSIPSDISSISTPTVIYFDPTEDQTPTIDVYSTKPNSSGMPERWRKAGTASADEDKTV